MRIGVDIRYTSTHSNGNGIGHYSEGLLGKLAEFPEIEIFHFHENEEWTGGEFAHQLKKFMYKNKIDIFHISSPMEVKHPQVFSNTNLRPVRITATVYDIIPFIFQDVYLGNDRIREFYLTQLKMLEHMDHLFAISEYTRQDFLRIGIRPERITTVGTGRDNGYYYMPAATLVDFSHLFSIRDPYVLGFSPADWRKNSERLVQAFSLATHGNTERYQLVFVNNAPEAVREHLYNVAREYGTENRIYFTGRVSQLQLLRLFIRAHALVFPSLYEGFGIPVLEAMQCGTPVVTSNTTSLPEVAGDAAIYVDPTDMNSIAEGIRKVLSDAELRQTLRQAGLQRVKLFDWDLVANRTLSIYQSLFQESLSERMTIRLQESFSDRMTIRLRPNRCAFVKSKKIRGRASVYFAFNLAELPAGSIIENAEMHIPIKKNSKKQRIYKVHTRWSATSIRQLRHPLVKPLHKARYKQAITQREKYSLIQLECTKLTKKWARHRLRNQGLYVRHVYHKRKPSLYVTVKLPDKET